MSDIRICFVGDSFVNGAGDPEFLGWVGRLCAAANSKGNELTCYNLGVRRNTSSDILKRWHEIESRFMAGADNRLVLSFGVNDTVLENGLVRVSERQALQNMRQLLTQSKKLPCIVVGPPPVTDETQNERIRIYSQKLAIEADVAGIPFIELYSRLVNDGVYLQEVSANDQAHPRGSGYAKIAELVGQHPSWWFRC